MLYFTSIHCKPCEKEIPELLQLIKKSQKNILCYFVYAEGIEEVNAQASQYGITYIVRMCWVRHVPAWMLYVSQLLYCYGKTGKS